jgi:hypothetical protein
MMTGHHQYHLNAEAGDLLFDPYSRTRDNAGHGIARTPASSECEYSPLAISYWIMRANAEATSKIWQVICV